MHSQSVKKKEIIATFRIKILFIPQIHKEKKIIICVNTIMHSQSARKKKKIISTF